ncbi:MULTISPECIES: hypothetical protein [unclassified Methylophaga]|jgi:hypothetical protein|uniref:hypothetical protein n=1 Tax=unclassified Methylophaga TaxID=2629249 RepID=UPI00259CFC34|nr:MULTISPECIES: hypothetical protein [unclassified Methylophaga]|tara:strand:- start:28485 stop:28763 length:279 start_codon:yes stop_codon:yes gene_type:complete
MSKYISVKVDEKIHIAKNSMSNDRFTAVTWVDSDEEAKLFLRRLNKDIEKNRTECLSNMQQSMLKLNAMTLRGMEGSRLCGPYLGGLGFASS